MIRQPIYLDEDRLQGAADVMGLDYPVDVKVREVDTANRRGGGKAGFGSVGVDGERGSGTEREATYEVVVRPARVLNQLIEKTLQEATVKDFTAGGEPSVVRRDLVQLEGHLQESALTEAAEIVTAFLPHMMDQLPGVDDGKVPVEFVKGLLAPRPGGPSKAIYEVIDSGVPVRVIVQVDPRWLFGAGSDLEDLTGELTIFGTVDQLVAEGDRLDLTRFLFPSMNRTMRRQFGTDTTAKLLSNFGDNAEPEIDGPLWIVKPIAIF